MKRQKIKLLLTLFLLTLLNQSWALTQVEIDAINIKAATDLLNGRLELNDILLDVNGNGNVERPVGDGVGDDLPYFISALQRYENAGIAGYIVLQSNKTYRITGGISIFDQPGITIQGRGDGLNRSTIKFDFAEVRKNHPGIHIVDSGYVNLRKLRFISTSNYIGDAIKVKTSNRLKFNDLVFDNVYNGIRHANSFNLLLSNIVMNEPRGIYGVYSVGSPPTMNVNNELVWHNSFQLDIVDFHGNSTQNNQLIWIRMGNYTATYDFLKVSLSGGLKGIVADYISDPSKAAKFIEGIDININNTIEEGIHLKAGHDIQLSRVTIENSGADGIRIEPEFKGVFLVSEPTITGSGKNGIYIGNGHQVHIYDPVIGYNSTNNPNQYSGIYVATGTKGYSVNYGVIGDFNATNNNYQKYAIEIDGVKGIDSNYFSVVDVQDIGNYYPQQSSSDPSGEWFYITRPDRINYIPRNSPFTNVTSLVTELSNYPEDSEVTIVPPGYNLIQPEIDNLCTAGGTIWLAPGRHRITDSTSIPDNLTINSCSNLKIIQASKCVGCDLFLMDDSSSIIVENSNNISLLDFLVTTWGYSEANPIFSHSNNAIKIINSQNTTIKNITVTNTARGVLVDGSSNTKITNSLFFKVNTKAIEVRGSKTHPTNDTFIFRMGYYDQTIENLGNSGYGTGIATVIRSYTNNTQLIISIALASGYSLVTTGSLDENNQLVHPENIIGYQVVSDHNAKNGILITAGINMEFTNLWLASNIDHKCEPWPRNPAGADTGCIPSSHLLITNGENIKIFDSLIQGAGGHGIHVVSGKNIQIINSVSGRNGKYSPSGTCDFDGIRVEAVVDGFNIRGGTSGNLFDNLYGNLPWTHQRRGLTLLSLNSSLVKGFDFHENCWNPPTYGAPGIQQYNPGW